MNLTALNDVYMAVKALERIAERENLSDEAYEYLSTIRRAVARELAMRVQDEERKPPEPK